MIVATKMANSCHDFGVMPSGTGASKIAKPENNTSAHFPSFDRSGFGGSGSNSSGSVSFSFGVSKWLWNHAAEIEQMARRYYYVAITYSRVLPFATATMSAPLR